MSQKYDEYLSQHRLNVFNAFSWLKENAPEIFGSDVIISEIEYNIQYNHDRSKNEPIEYIAYDAYFYGNNRSNDVVTQFNMAWLHHIHKNPHHWQYWILHNDDKDKGTLILDMPDAYIIEMICDWWSFSFAKGDLNEIFTWYDEHKDYIMLSDKTKSKVEKVLDILKKKIPEYTKKLEEAQKAREDEKAAAEAQAASNIINFIHQDKDENE